MEYCFIDNNKPLDRISQKIVRSHAMKGKNVGRTITARGHRGRQRENEGDHTPILQPEIFSEIRNGRIILPKVSSLKSSPAATERITLLRNPLYQTELLPEPLTSSSRYLLHEFYHVISQTLYPSIFCRQLDEAKFSWFELMIRNPCVFHCALGMTGAYIMTYRGHRDTSFESIRHLVKAMSLLRHELSATPEPQDSSFAVIISLAIHANLVKSVQECRIHLQGLKYIIESRSGGLTGLCTRIPEIGNKIRRTDIDLALSAGSLTLFGSQASPLPATLYVMPTNERAARVSLPSPLNDTSPYLRAMARDIFALCSYAGYTKFGAFQYQDIILSIFQRLVDFSPLNGPRPQIQLDDSCQLGLLVFMSTIVHHDPQRRSVCSLLLSETLKVRLRISDDTLLIPHANDYASYFLWLFFVYAISSPDYDSYCHDTNSSVARSVRALLLRLEIQSWADVKASLESYPWIPAFHGDSARRLWEQGICM
ncbi:unnamed protein product [Periconia digitata]|uniref:Fungal-specific transcription factor domain-containing protein n=1 Tax=Periconia digitata TaxID=1303443 RepID=A0A9W4U3B8_9PLEO|nr:unnamed protein product [Periconia digitata]